MNQYAYTTSPSQHGLHSTFEKRERKGRGILFYLCLTVSVLSAIAIGTALWGWSYFTGIAVDAVLPYTEANARKLPLVAPSFESPFRTNSKLHLIQELVSQSRVQTEFSLSGGDLNTYIATEPDLRFLKDYVRVDFKGNDFITEFSIPLSKIPFISGLENRYLNGTAAFEVSMDNGILFMGLRTLSLPDRLPQEVREHLQKTNFAKEFYKNKESIEFIQRVDSVEIRDDRIFLKIAGLRN